jgi:hypothetical protein
MSDKEFEAFRLLVTEPDDGMLGGSLKMHYLAVKRSPDEAIAAVRAARARTGTVEVIGQGPDQMAEARRRGLRDDDVSEL